MYKGQNLSATATAQAFTTGDPTERHTLVNDGPSIAFYRSLTKPSATTATGTEAELRDLDYSELKVGDGVILSGSGRAYQYVCGTGNTATLRLIAGTLLMEKSVVDVPSTLYDGDGSGALTMLGTVDLDTLVALVGTADVVDCGRKNILHVWLSNSTASQSGTLCVAEFSAATPTAATCINITEVAFTTTDLLLDVDRSSFGQTAATDHYVKTPMAISVTPGAYVMICMTAELGGAWYARYELLGSV